MSFILDALKKSESERQRQIGPSLADVRISRRVNDKPWWVVAVAALLVLNLAVLFVVLARHGAAAPAVHPTAAVPPAVSSAQTRDASTQVPLPASAARKPRGNPPAANPAVRALSEEAEDYGSTAPDIGRWPAAAALVPERAPVVQPIDGTAVASSRPGLDSRAAASNEMLPTVNDLATSGTRLPEMHLDIHVYSANPAERFVFVNMRKYNEGQSLSEGPILERITADGAILNHNGLRFLLPRQ